MDELPPPLGVWTELIRSEKFSINHFLANSRSWVPVDRLMVWLGLLLVDANQEVPLWTSWVGGDAHPRKRVVQNLITSQSKWGPPSRTLSPLHPDFKSVSGV